MKMSLIKSLPIIEIDNFYSSNESDAILETRWNGFKSALSHYPTYYRNKYILRSDIYVSRHVESNHHDGYIWNLLKVDESHFLSCGRDTTIKLWNKELQLLKIFKLHSKSVIKITKLNDKEFISCSRDFTLKKWTNSGKVLSSICLNEMLLNIAIHTSEKQVVAVGTSGKVFVLNSELTLLKTIKVHKHWVWGITWIDNDVVTCGEDGTVSITNITASTTKCILRLKEALYSMYCNKEFIFLGTKNGTVIKLSRSKNKLEILYLHKDIVRSILYYKNQIISCGEDNRIIRYNILNGHKEQIREANNFIQDCIILNGQIYAAGFDGRITIDNI